MHHGRIASQAPLDAARRRRTTRTAGAGVLLSLGALALSSCAAGGGGQEGGGSEDELTVVTSTAVYADIAQQVAGDGVTVTPVIDSPSQDPHSYEAAPADRLTVEDADLIIMNGGGYDSFMTDLIGDSDVPVIDAVELSELEGAAEAAESGHSHDHSHEGEGHAHEEGGHDHGGEEHAHEEEGHEGHDHGSFNEHVWYHLPTMGAVAEAVGEELAELDPDGAQDYEQGAEDFGGELEQLSTRTDELGLEGDFLATEPVADHLLEQAGLHDATPEDFTAAVESGSDIPALTYAEVEEDVRDGQVDLFSFNEHTASGQTEQLRDAAEDAGLPVASFTETMPEGQSYLEWMSGNVDTIDSAL